jgi:hypothetical protein
VAEESVPVNASDVTAQASKIIAANPEVIVGALPDVLAELDRSAGRDRGGGHAFQH